MGLGGMYLSVCVCVCDRGFRRCVYVSRLHPQHHLHLHQLLVLINVRITGFVSNTIVGGNPPMILPMLIDV